MADVLSGEFEMSNFNCVPTAMQEKAAYSLGEAGRRSSLGKTKLYEMIKAGKLRAVKCGRKTLVLSEDLDLFLSSLQPIGGGK